ncbi:MAG: hypothetical protein GY847_11895 [Proteobacteria bacterium]|nr:hypothetical protein [Pseudomonadota bacterium]
MPVKTALPSVNVGDFFAIVVPGFYVICTASLFGFMTIPRNAQQDEPWKIICQAVANMDANWIALCVVASYLVGNIMRILPVKWPDAWCGWIFGKLLRSRKELYEEGETFPYPKALKRRFDRLGGQKVFNLPEAPTEKEGLYVVFNYWKIILCKESPELFACTQVLEARVRMFVGIIWATGVGVILGGVQFIIPGTRVWWEPLLLSSLISFAIFLLFLLLLREARNEEARTVFFSYLALQGGGNTNVN